MNYDPRITVDSTVVPGARFTLKRLSVPRRAQYNLAYAEFRAQVREIRRERAPLDKEYMAAVEAARKAAEPEIQALIAAGKSREEAEKLVPLPPIDFAGDKAERWSELNGVEVRISQGVLCPAVVRTVLESIEGFEIRGKVPTVEELIAEGPADLLDEIAAHGNRIMGLSATESGNLQSPSTSEPPGAGQTTSTAATPAASES